MASPGFSPGFRALGSRIAGLNKRDPAPMIPAFSRQVTSPATHTMEHEQERNLGEQPIARLMAQHGVKPHDLVKASDVPMTHKMVSRACKGRRLTSNTQHIVLNALNRVTGTTYRLGDLFNY